MKLQNATLHVHKVKKRYRVQKYLSAVVSSTVIFLLICGDTVSTTQENAENFIVISDICQCHTAVMSVLFVST